MTRVLLAVAAAIPNQAAATPAIYAAFVRRCSDSVTQNKVAQGAVVQFESNVVYGGGREPIISQAFSALCPLPVSGRNGLFPLESLALTFILPGAHFKK